MTTIHWGCRSGSRAAPPIDTVSQLLGRADGATYTAKRGGKGGVHIAADTSAED
jgi:hypothetical protein